MSVNHITDICVRIQEHCQQRNWYGPDGGFEDERCYIDAQGKLQVQVIYHNPHTGFEFAPATEKQLQVTEEALGIPLPPMLRALYTQVANGGFGPATGITGAHGGYFFGNDGMYQTIDMCTDTNPEIHYVDMSEYEQGHDNLSYFEMRNTVKPAHFLPLCYEGCGQGWDIDGISGRIYFVFCARLLGDFAPNQKVPGKSRLEWIVGYQQVTDSLEDWLEYWLCGETQKLYHIRD